MSVTLSDIVAAEHVIRPYIRVTPVLEVDPKEFGVDWGGRLTLKLESLQHTGSFKARGAFTTLLTPAMETRPVAAVSGGNHGAAVGYAAQKLGIDATIFVPEYAPKKKIEKIRSYGADLRIVGATIAETFEACDAFMEETGARNVHPYGAATTIAGQGTVGLEWAAQTPSLDAVLIAIGGGGLISGVAAAMQAGPDVIGVEPEGARCAYEARHAGGPVDFPPNSIAADSLGAPSIGALNHEIIDDFVDELVLVSDEAIREAQMTLWRLTGLTVEPGAATSLAALASGAFKPEAGAHVGAMICGSNVDLSQFG